MVSLKVTALLQLVHLDFTSFKSTMDLDWMPEVKNVLVIADHFTRYMRAHVTEDQKASTDTKCLYEGFIFIFGAPEKIITDQSKGFTSEVITELCTQFRVGKTMITPYHPQGNGQVEEHTRPWGTGLENRRTSIKNSGPNIWQS